jgi:hypothetical protein
MGTSWIFMGTSYPSKFIFLFDLDASVIKYIIKYYNQDLLTHRTYNQQCDASISFLDFLIVIFLQSHLSIYTINKSVRMEFNDRMRSTPMSKFIIAIHSFAPFRSNTIRRSRGYINTSVSL